MAITSLAQVVSGLQPPAYFVKTPLNPSGGYNQPYTSSWPVAGLPPAGVESVALGGTALTNAATGALIPWNDPPGGTNAYIARFQCVCSWTGGQVCSGVMLCDRLWSNGGMDLTGVSGTQTISSPTWPARDVAGTSNGDGVLIGLEISVTTNSATTQNITLGYTNQSGVSGRTSNPVGASTGAAAISQLSAFVIFGLAGTDTGVQRVDSISIPTGGWTSGTINLVAFRPLLFMDAEIINRVYALDASSGVLPRIYNGSCLFIVMKGRSSSSQGTAVTGEVQVTWG